MRETTYTCFSFSVTTYQNDLYTLMNTRVDHFIEMTVVSVCLSVCVCVCAAAGEAGQGLGGVLAL